MSLLMEATYSTVSCLLSNDWDPQPSYSGSDYYISRTDGGMRRWVEEWKGGWTAGGLHTLPCGKCFIICFCLTPYFCFWISFLEVHSTVKDFLQSIQGIITNTLSPGKDFGDRKTNSISLKRDIPIF